MDSKLKQYMTSSQRAKLKSLPTTHQNCIDLVGVARPGKTRKERARKIAS